MNIKLRLLKQSDLESLLLIENDKRYWHLSGTTEPFTSSELKEYISNASESIDIAKQLRFAIELNEQLTGLIDLYDYDAANKSAGVGIFILDEFRNKKVGSESLKLLKEHCISKLNLKSLFARIEDYNFESIKLFQKAEFVLQEKLPQYIQKEDTKVDCGEYWINLDLREAD